MVFSQILVLRPRPQETSCLILTYFAKRSIFYAGSCSCLKKVPQDANMKNPGKTFYGGAILKSRPIGPDHEQLN